MRSTLARPLLAAGLATFAVACQTGDRSGTAPVDPEVATAAVATPAVRSAARQTNEGSTQAGPAQHASVEIGNVGSCEPSAEVTTAVSRFVDLADADSDGRVSRAEAQSAGNFVVGGLFFRADQNADGKVTPEEGKITRDEFLKVHPAIAALLAQAREVTGRSAFKELARVLDVKYGDTLTIEDARKVANSALDDAFRVADSNGDATITRDEAINASWAGAQALGRNVFSAADTNSDAKLSAEEFEKAVAQSATRVFKMADTNGDDGLSEQEASVAMRNVARQLGIPEPT